MWYLIVCPNLIYRISLWLKAWSAPKGLYLEWGTFLFLQKKKTKKEQKKKTNKKHSEHTLWESWKHWPGSRTSYPFPAAGAPVILLLFNGGPLDVSWAHNSDDITAIMECWFPAQSAGVAIRNALYNSGPSANPAGRLPMTWPKTLDGVRLYYYSLSLHCYSESKYSVE